jgi:hypothetical protein
VQLCANASVNGSSWLLHWGWENVLCLAASSTAAVTVYGTVAVSARVTHVARINASLVSACDAGAVRLKRSLEALQLPLLLLL